MHTMDPDHAKAVVRQFQGDNFYVLDQDGKVVEIGDGCFNDPTLKGFCKTDFLGKCLWDLSPKCKDSNFFHKFQFVLNSHESAHFEHQSFLNPNSHLMIHMFPLDGGVLVYTFNISCKIELLNHLKVTNERFKFLNDELKQLMFYMQHDLRNPLNTITVLLEALMLEKENYSIDDNNIFVQLFGATEKMKNVLVGIQKLIDMTQRPRLFRSIDISSLVIMCINTCMTRDQSRKCIYKVKRARIKADVELMQMAITNLIENAWKFTRERNVTEITFDYVTNDNGDPVFSITDNGIGFDSNKFPHIFEPFKRAHKHIEGTGLGLAIVQRAINYHRGNVWAHSKPNEGASFFFALPQQHFEPARDDCMIITNNGGTNHEEEISCVWPALQLDPQLERSETMG